ncbi:MAG: porin [Bacteroidota bacterium]
MKKIIRVLFIFFSLNLAAQEESKPKIPDFLRSIEPYGTFEYAAAGYKDGIAVVDLIPRVGVAGEWFFKDSDDYYFFTKAEIGLHLTRRNDYITISVDPGGKYGKTDNAIYARQGFIGIGTPFGRISVGKQWGVHYALAGNIDNMYIFGGDAIGVYNAGTDGGPSGTGRADQSIKYEFSNDRFYVGVQGQFRNFSSNNVKFADAAGISSYYDFRIFKFGLSYNKVFDGVEVPIPGETKTDDEFFSALIDVNRENFHFGILGNIFNNHEKDNSGEFFKGWGVEYNLKYNFGKEKEWSFVNNSSIMKPFSDEDMEYISNRYSFELARRFSQNTAVILGFRYDNSTNADGIKNKIHHVALGFYYNFNYPVP